MPPPQNHVRMAHGVERDGLVLEVFDQRPLQIGVGRALQAGVERLEHNLHPVRLAIARDENLREAAAVQPLHHFVAFVDQTVFKFQFRHLCSATRATWGRGDGAIKFQFSCLPILCSLSHILSIAPSPCLPVASSPFFFIPPA